MSLLLPIMNQVTYYSQLTCKITPV